MQLDDNVCRGSLIIHKEERLVVIGRGVGVNPLSGRPLAVHTQFAGWKVISVYALEREEVCIKEHRIIKDGTEVDFFFPGVVYKLPDYII